MRERTEDKNAALGTGTEGLKDLQLVVNWGTDEQKDWTRSGIIVPSIYAPLKEDKIHLLKVFKWSTDLSGV